MYMLFTHPVNCVAFCALLLRTRILSCAEVTIKPCRRRGVEVYSTCSEPWQYAKWCVNLRVLAICSTAVVTGGKVGSTRSGRAVGKRKTI